MRFYPTHAQASDFGVDFAEEVVGEGAVEEELPALAARYRRTAPMHDQRATFGPPDCDNPKYFDYLLSETWFFYVKGERALRVQFKLV
ncbi:MAG: hypothetical protein CM1200mP39_22460 [Dehalococcoidia bacterium]|nr:MAG: hypothetical protein CM1200mP39_22460 [Dehalococcoidia bacterium]